MRIVVKKRYTKAFLIAYISRESVLVRPSSKAYFISTEVRLLGLPEHLWTADLLAETIIHTSSIKGNVPIVLPHCDLLCSSLVHLELGLDVHLLDVGHGSVEVVKDLWQGDGIHGRLSIVFWQVNHARPERHLDLDEGLVTVREQILCLPGVDADNAQKKVAAGSQGHLHLNTK